VGAIDRDERGAATVTAVAFLGVLVLVGSALGVAAAMVHAHRVAQSGADMSALAAAGALVDGTDPCAAAASVAQRNATTLTDCLVNGRQVLVEVTAPGPRWLGQPHDLVASARAGQV